eukprot:jgi/Phyca11/511564/fgenesh2_kg.PHYCAscaffold_89_\
MDPRPKCSSYSSNSSAGSYSSAIASPVQQNQLARSYRGNCRNWDRSPRGLAADASVSPVQPQPDLKSSRVIVRSNSDGKPPVPASNLSPHDRRAPGGTRGSNRFLRSHSAGNSVGSSPQDVLYARLLELNDVAEQTSAYLTSRARRMS